MKFLFRIHCYVRAVLLLLTDNTVTALSAGTSSNKNVVILGGTGRIGTAIATHLIRRSSSLPSSTRKIILVGRNAQQGQQSVQEVLDATSEFSSSDGNSFEVEFRSISDVWDAKQLSPLFHDAAAVIHTAGPYHNRYPIPLRTAIESRVPVYVDVSDPLSYLDSSLELNDDAKSSGTSALVAAGAFPGLSNLLAMEAAGSLPSGCQIIDSGFNYFTAGLGGSGDVNLYITNLGFGDDMPQYEKGRLNYFKALTGKLLGKVDFFTDAESIMAKRVGSQQVFSWPFPEAATVARELQIKGRSHAAMVSQSLEKIALLIARAQILTINTPRVRHRKPGT
jgi:saccharopine dehydrogenase-like NADP-dependent oxidoreductase